MVLVCDNLGIVLVEIIEGARVMVSLNCMKIKSSPARLIFFYYSMDCNDLFYLVRIAMLYNELKGAIFTYTTC